MIKFMLGFVLGFAAHYAIFCSKDIKQKCVQCWEFAKLKSKIQKANKKRKGKK